MAVFVGAAPFGGGDVGGARGLGGDGGGEDVVENGLVAGAQGGVGAEVFAVELDELVVAAPEADAGAVVESADLGDGERLWGIGAFGGIGRVGHGQSVGDGRREVWSDGRVECDRGRGGRRDIIAGGLWHDVRNAHRCIDHRGH